MYRSEELMRIKNRLPENVNDKTLGQCYDDAAAAICEYCNRDAVPDSAAGLLRELTAIFYMGNDRRGEVSRSEGAISVSYSADDIPTGLKLRLNSCRLLKAVRRANEGKKS